MYYISLVEAIIKHQKIASNMPENRLDLARHVKIREKY